MRLVTNTTAAAIAAALLLAACSTSPVATGDATPVPAERVLNKQLTRRAPGAVEVFVKRDSGMSGIACAITVYVDASPVAELRTSEVLALYLSEGEHMLGAKQAFVCGGGTAEVHAVLRAGARTYSYRLGYGNAGEFIFQPTAF